MLKLPVMTWATVVPYKLQTGDVSMHGIYGNIFE